MAARRLLIVMLLLLAVSTLAAALVPPPQRSGEPGSTSAAGRQKGGSSEGGASQGRGHLIQTRISAQARKRPTRVLVGRGDQLELTVSSTRTAAVSIPAFGLTDFAEPGDPARFDVLVDRAGAFEVRVDGAGTAARIVSRPAG